LQLLDLVKEQNPDLPIVMISGHGNVETAVAAIKRGAYDFIEKPFKSDRLLLVAERALETFKLKREVRELRIRAPKSAELIGQSQHAGQLRQAIDKVAATNARVLISGPSGSGKELAARMIHASSSRAGGPFVVLNAATITPESMETELFGIENSGTVPQRIGALEEAHGGTLLLDEIADMPKETQSKILRVLQEGEFSRVGGNETLQTDVRIVCATNKNLEDEVFKRTFREDLFYRLNVVRIHIPPLRQRVEDIRLLAEYFLQKIANRKHTLPIKLSEEAARVLESYPWPGNVRELENTLQRAAVLSRADILLPKDIPLGVAAPETAQQEGATATELLPRDRAVEVLFQAASEDDSLRLLPWIEREFTIRAMQKTGDNQVRAAKLLGITRATLRKRLDRNSGVGLEEDEESEFIEPIPK
jgi:DNA-binding NtrC family response regulator